MSDPQTSALGFYQPARGTDPGTWDLPINANSGAADSLFTATATISLSNAPFTLTTPPNTGSSWSGPYQSQSALLKFTGALSANCLVTLPRPGFYIAWNLCTSGNFGAGAIPGSFPVRLTTGVAGGKVIGLPPGEKVHVFSDGTDVDFVNLGRVGSRFDLIGLTGYPAWMSACTVLPYLIRDGSVYNRNTYPALANVLGNVFGGTPGVSFAVPDSRARVDVGFDPNGTGRMTVVINGSVMGAAGGDQNSQAHTHTGTTGGESVAHVHGVGGLFSAGFIAGSPGNNANTELVTAPNFRGSQNTGGESAAHTHNFGTSNFGAGFSENVQPSIVSHLPLIKT